jgi:hypothetical protein
MHSNHNKYGPKRAAIGLTYISSHIQLDIGQVLTSCVADNCGCRSSLVGAAVPYDVTSRKFGEGAPQCHPRGSQKPHSLEEATFTRPFTLLELDVLGKRRQRLNHGGGSAKKLIWFLF